MKSLRCNKSFRRNMPSAQRLSRRYSSFSIYGTVWLLMGIAVCKTSFSGRLYSHEDSRVTMIWVESFSPPAPLSSSHCSGASNNNKKDRWQSKHQDCTTHVPTTHTAFSKGSSFSSLLPLYAGGDETDERPPVATTAVVLSVFSKPPSKVFRDLLEGSTAATGLLGLEDISGDGNWNELNEMIDDKDLTIDELRELFDAAVVDGKEGLDLEGFQKFYKSIDDLFDDDDEEFVNESDQSPSTVDLEMNEASDNTEIESRSKGDLISYIEEVQSRPCDSEDGALSVGERRPWGLDCSDRERKNLSVLIENLLVGKNSNILGGNRSSNSPVMSAKDLTKHIIGTWDLRYTSSRTMIINKSLSGLGRSTSDMARNLGLQMTLSGSYYCGKAEFLEAFGSGGSVETDSDDQIDAVLVEAMVTGEWILETGARMDYKTGLPSVSLRVEVETIAYGPNKSDAEQWDSLSPIKLVDVLYLDDDLMILRGNANVAAIFVYTRH